MMGDLDINTVDLLVIAVLLISGVLAFWRGFVQEVLSITAWIGAAFVALYGLPLARPLARRYIEADWIADAAAGGALFLVTLLVLSLLTQAIARRVRGSALNGIDRSLGFVFGVARGAFLVCLAYMFGVWLTDGGKPPEWLEAARTRPLMEYGARAIQKVLPDEYGKTEAVAKQAAEDARRAMEAERAYRELTQPRPRAAQGTPPSRPGYADTERQGMDQLFKSNQ